MGSRREEERNEKIIRGLMKLPPNRRCINCNSLGPQYVCTNFWTFICMTCSGIHREFTHRVKSVSMAKFTSQEVEALQNGGNQRARETFLKDWDQQRERLPDSSNAVKVREFIKAVYVDKKYAGGKSSDKPPRDTQGIRGLDDETRRASSYHSYSQSPPYDYQYEERKYGKHGAGLMRRPGSDRGLEGKISSFVYSPGRSSEHTYEDRFANEGSVGRASDFSVSSGGDPFRSGAQSPTFQKDTGFSSPTVHQQKRNLGDNLSRQSSNKSLEANLRRDADGIPRPQRTVSAGSFGSFDSSSMSLHSFNSSSLLDAVSETEQAPGIHHKKTSSYPQANIPGSPGNIDLFNTQNIPEPPVDLFEAATFSSPSQDLFQTHPKYLAPSFQSQSPQTPSSPLDLFADFPEPQSSTAFASSLMDPPIPKNDGWATFDSPESVAPNSATENPSVKLPSTGDTVAKFDPFSTQNPSIPKLPSSGGTVEKFDPFSSLDPGMDWSISQKPKSVELPSSTPDPWLGAFSNVQTATSNIQPWNAFDDSKEQLPSLNAKQPSEQLTAVQNSAMSDQYLDYGAAQDFNNHANPRTVPPSGHSGFVHSVPSDVVGTQFPPPMLTQMADALARASGNSHKSTNPFDLPYDSDSEQSTTFLDMSSLHASLPTAQLPPTLLDGVSPSWFPHNAVTPHAPASSHGGIGFMSGQIPSSQIPNVATQGPVASVGGNPFA